MSDHGKETIAVVEVDIPFCSRVYGDAVGFEGIDFDGSTHWLTTGQHLTGVVDSKQGILSMWLRLDGGDAASQTLMTNCETVGGSGGFKVLFYRSNDNKFHLDLDDTAGTPCLVLVTVATYVAGATWRHVLMSWDQNAGVNHLYVSDVSDKAAVATNVNANVGYAGSGGTLVQDWSIGATCGGTNKTNGAIAEVFFAPGNYLDFSVEANRRKFISSTLHPVPLGENGELPLGVAPAVYLGINTGALAASFPVNRGASDDFSDVHGTLVIADTSPQFEEGCKAVLGVDGNKKCYNTRVTCQDPENYLPETKVIRFSHPQRGLIQYDNIIPSLALEADNPKTTAGAINLGGMDRNLSALGVREVVDIDFDDHRWNDNQFDKYRLERITGDASLVSVGTAAAGAIDSITLADEDSTDALGLQVRIVGGTGDGQTRTVVAFDPTSKLVMVEPDWAVGPDGTSEYELRDAFKPEERGSFWGKFIARNPYYVNYRARVLRGFMGQPLSELRTRHYIIDRITGPKDGRVRMVLKDLFSLIEARKSVAPIASLGELSANITGTPATFSVLPAGIGNTATEDGGYASITNLVSGYVAIGDEIIEVTRVDDTFTVVDRGALNTVQEDHDDEDLVQLVLSIEAELAHDIIHLLLTSFSGILSAEIPKALWDVLAASMPEQYTARIAEPTPVRDLIGEICEQAGCTVWHSPETGLVEFVPLRSTSASLTLRDRDIADRQFEVKRQDEKRVSKVLVYYGQINPMEDVDDRRNFRSRAIVGDGEAEGPQQYGVPALREIFSRWMPQFGRQQALATGERILALFRDPPIEARFNLPFTRDGALSLAKPFLLKTFELQDSTGAESPTLLAPIQLSRDDIEVVVRAQGLKFSTEPADGVRRIFLDTAAMFNLNMRTVHDGIYAAPVGGETVEVIVVEGFIVGSTNATVAALRTGSWPVGVDLKLIVEGRVQGKGGNAGAGGSGGGAGGAGQKGGDAILVEYEIIIDNTNGEIWGGGGGGGGGGSAIEGGSRVAGGGGGGGGAGTIGGNGGNAGSNLGGFATITVPGAGTAGTASAAGVKGQRGEIIGVGAMATNHIIGGAGGNGGGAGAAGAAGAAGVSDGIFDTGAAGGAAGAAGRYVVGNSLVTWDGFGDRRGGVA